MQGRGGRIGKRRLRRVAVYLATTLCLSAVHADPVDQHQLGSKYSPLAQINRDNVAQLERTWEFRTGDLPPEGTEELTAFEDQPSLVEGNLVVCSIDRRLYAIDPATGVKRWAFDPGKAGATTRKCRGIANWVDASVEEGTHCRSRIFLGTADYRLVAIDARDGRPCAEFGEDGIVDMPISREELWPGEVVAGSNPAVVNDVVVVGSAVADNQRVAAPSGRVLAFDARTGEALWSFDPIPRDPNDPAMASWHKGTENFGQGNVWSSMAVDRERDLVYLPTTSPSNDFYGGERAGNNHYTTSVVALRGATGEVAWHQQLVHHNVWDYDIPTRPILIDYPHGGENIPALVQNTKMGMIFIFDRATGEPLVPIEERPVPQEGGVPGEILSPTQPFPVGMPNLVPHGFSPDDAWGMTPIDEYFCRKTVEEHDYGPIYTPVSERGTVVYPSVGGGPNWGGGAYDPESHIMVVPSNRVPTIVRLIPREKAPVLEGLKIEGMSLMTFPNPGSPYVLQVEPLLSIFGAPCVEPPWAALTAVNIVKKTIEWEVPLGSIRKMSPLPLDIHLGTPGAGGPLVTAGGLVFIGYSLDDTLRAFDLESGEILWEADLPAGGNAIPVSYEIDGEQYIVIAAGGHSMYGATMGDSVVAFKLPK